MGKTFYPDVKIDPERQIRTLELQPTVSRGESVWTLRRAASASRQSSMPTKAMIRNATDAEH